METGVCVMAKMKAKAGKETELKEALTALVGPTREEPDCIEYLLHQAKDDASVFAFYEQWSSQKALDRHLKMPYLQAFFARTDDLLDGPPEILLYDLVI